MFSVRPVAVAATAHCAQRKPLSLQCHPSIWETQDTFPFFTGTLRHSHSTTQRHCLDLAKPNALSHFLLLCDGFQLCLRTKVTSWIVYVHSDGTHATTALSFWVEVTSPHLRILTLLMGWHAMQYYLYFFLLRIPFRLFEGELFLKEWDDVAHDVMIVWTTRGAPREPS